MLTLPEFIDRYNDIHLLCLEGSHSDIRHCLSKDPTAAHRHNENGLLPVHLIVQRDHDDVVAVLELLLARNADVNGRTLVEGDTALHLVLSTVDVDRAMYIARKLITHGANPRIRNKKLMTAYDVAVSRGYGELADLLNSDRWLRNPQALTTAVAGGTVNDVLKCIRLGSDVDLKSEVGAAPIHYAVSHRLTSDKTTVIDILVKNGAVVNSLNRAGDTVLNVAIKELPPGDEMLFVVSYLLDIGVNQNIKNHMRKTARQVADDRGYEDVVALLDGKALSGVQNKLFKAVKESRTEELRALLKTEGHKVDLYNEDGQTPLHVAANRAYYVKQNEVIRLLVAGGASIDLGTEVDNDTPLHLVAKLNNHQAAEQLLRLGADTNRKNREGETALDICICKKHIKVKALILAKKRGSQACAIL